MTLRAAVLGTGSWARKIHLPALAAHPLIDLVGVWGRDGSATRATATMFGVEAYEDLDRLLSTVDLVSIAVTPDAQPALAAAAARAGAHLVLEKPAANDLPACRTLAATVEAAAVHASVFLSRLWDPARRDWLDAAAAHRWHTIRYGWVSAGMRPESPGATGWRKDAGPLLDVGPHIVGLAEYLAGPVTSLRAVAPGEGRLVLELTHAGKCVTWADADLLAAVASTQEHVELVGEDGGRSYRNPKAVDFLAAYTAMLDDLLTQAARTQDVSPRSAACSLASAVTQAELLDEARSQLRSNRGPDQHPPLAPA